MKKTRSSGILAVIIITLVAIGILSTLTFAIPFVKFNVAILVTSYVCAVVMILLTGAVALSGFFLERNKNQAILSLPIFRNMSIACTVQLIATITFYVLNALFEFIPIWTLIVTEVLIYGVALVFFMMGYFFKKRNEEYHARQANTKVIDEVRARLRALNTINKIDAVSKELQDLLETSHGSDPISNERTIDSESELLSNIQELDEAIKSNQEAEAREAIEKTKNTLLERNALCKLGKQ